MERDEALTAIREVAVEVLSVQPEAVVETARFAEDLDADSLDLVELVMGLEERFDVSIPEEDLEGVATVGDAVDLVLAKASQRGMSEASRPPGATARRGHRGRAAHPRRRRARGQLGHHARRPIGGAPDHRVRRERARGEVRVRGAGLRSRRRTSARRRAGASTAARSSGSRRPSTRSPTPVIPAPTRPGARWSRGPGSAGSPRSSSSSRSTATKGPDRVSPFFVPMMMPNSTAGSDRHPPRMERSDAVHRHRVRGQRERDRRGHPPDPRRDRRRRDRRRHRGEPHRPGGRRVRPHGCAEQAQRRPGARLPTVRRGPRRLRDGRGRRASSCSSGTTAPSPAARASTARSRATASNSDAFHITAPSEGGAGAAACMQLALDDADIAADAIGHVNAHGTSTELNDAAESEAIRKVFGDASPPVTATKGVTGHLIGAAGAIEAIVALQAGREGVVPPVANPERLGDDIASIDVVAGEPRVIEPASGAVELVRLRRAQRHAGPRAPSVMLLEGKRILVTGVLNDQSIAFGVARVAQEQGAEVVLSSFGRIMRLTERTAKKLPVRARRSWSSTSPIPRDLDALAGRLPFDLDGVVHAIGFAPESCLGRRVPRRPLGRRRGRDAGVGVLAQGARGRPRSPARRRRRHRRARLRQPAPRVAGLRLDGRGEGGVRVDRALPGARARTPPDPGEPRGRRARSGRSPPARSRASSSSRRCGRPVPRSGGTSATPAPAAKAVVALLSDWFPATTGEIVHVDGGYHAIGA